MKNKKNLSEKIVVSFIIVTIIISSFVLIYSVQSLFFQSENKYSITYQTAKQMPTMSRMSLTSYDKELARKMMDENKDEKCDVCGMDVEQCIDSGQIQCNMDSKSTIGVLGSQHIHADWKIYIDGKEFDWSPYVDLHERQMKGDTNVQVTSAFIHIHPDPNEKAGSVLHMHATGVPLWIFFESMELKLPKGMKIYINKNEISDYKDYIFNNLDKILITDSNGDLQEQLNSI